MSANSDSGYWVFGLIVAAAAIYAYKHYGKDEAVLPPAPPLVIPTAASPSPSRPTEPIRIVETDAGAVWFLNPNSVRGDRTHRQGWVEIAAAKDKSVAWRTSSSLYMTDCETTQSKVVSTINYDAKGHVISSNSVDPAKAETTFWPPSSRGGMVVDAICDKRFDSK